MKKTSRFASLVAMLVLAACNIGNSPSKNASRFLNAFQERDYAEARKYATPETIKLIDLMENLSEMTTADDTVKHAAIEIVSEKKEDDTATVTFREKGSDETEEIKMKKIDGEWLVHITKADMSAKGNSTFNTGEEGLMMEPDTTSMFSEDSLATDEPE
jgi:hypothetical protein